MTEDMTMYMPTDVTDPLAHELADLIGSLNHLTNEAVRALAGGRESTEYLRGCVRSGDIIVIYVSDHLRRLLLQRLADRPAPEEGVVLTAAEAIAVSNPAEADTVLDAEAERARLCEAD